MGIYLNTEDAYFMYKSETMKPYFVDKSNMLKDLIPMVQEGNHFICVTRPRRFGKTIMANMIGAFFPMHVTQAMYLILLQLLNTLCIRST